MLCCPVFTIPAKLLVSDQYFVTHMRECLVNLHTHFRLQFLFERRKNEFACDWSTLLIFFYVYGVLAYDFEVSCPGL